MLISRLHLMTVTLQTSCSLTGCSMECHMNKSTVNEQTPSGYLWKTSIKSGSLKSIVPLKPFHLRLSLKWVTIDLHVTANLLHSSQLELSHLNCVYFWLKKLKKGTLIDKFPASIVEYKSTGNIMLAIFIKNKWLKMHLSTYKTEIPLSA